MADLMDPQGILAMLKAQDQAYQARINALGQPAPQQGGFLSGADPVMLALAQGLLSPTKSGGFGESLGNAAGAVQGPLSDIRKQEQARLDKIQALEDARTNMQLKMYDIQMGGARGYKPDDPSLVAGRWNKVAVDLTAEAGMLDENNPDEAPRKKQLLEEARHYKDLANAASGYKKKSEDGGDGGGEGGTPSKTKSKSGGPPADYPDAKKAPDGYWYVPNPDPNDKTHPYLRVE